MIRPIAYFAIIASLFLAEENIISSYSNSGHVNGVHIDKGMIEEMTGAFQNLNWEDLSQNSIHTIVEITEKVLSAAVAPIVNYGRDICDEAMQMSNQQKLN